MRCIAFLILPSLFGCSLGFDEKGEEPGDYSGTDTDTDIDTDPDTDTDTDVEPDPIAEGRTGTTICSSGGYVEGDSLSGSFCFAPVDLASGTTSTSASYQWQPGPITPVSP